MCYPGYYFSIVISIPPVSVFFYTSPFLIFTCFLFVFLVGEQVCGPGNGPDTVVPTVLSIGTILVGLVCSTIRLVFCISFPDVLCIGICVSTLINFLVVNFVSLPFIFLEVCTSNCVLFNTPRSFSIWVQVLSVFPALFLHWVPLPNQVCVSLFLYVNRFHPCVMVGLCVYISSRMSHPFHRANWFMCIGVYVMYGIEQDHPLLPNVPSLYVIHPVNITDRVVFVIGNNGSVSWVALSIGDSGNPQRVVFLTGCNGIAHCLAPIASDDSIGRWGIFVIGGTSSIFIFNRNNGVSK